MWNLFERCRARRRAALRERLYRIVPPGVLLQAAGAVTGPYKRKRRHEFLAMD